MKKNYTIALLFVFSLGFAQAPANYYNTATGTGYVLKTQLYNIIKTSIDRTYSGLYVTYTTSDVDNFYENDGTMLDMYTENPSGTECAFTYGVNQDDGTSGTSECQKYNREHIIPQSVFNSETPMYSDAHFVVPSDKYVNGQRGNFPFGKVNVANGTYSNGSKRGSNLNSGYSAGYVGTVFEPIDEFKGDIARMILYFATRYENLVSGWTYPMFNGTSNQVFTDSALNILLTWNTLDPVSNREIARNNAVYARQNNRNPFIDHPEYVTAIWGSALQNNTFDSFSDLVVYPNPSSDNRISIQTTNSISSLELYSVNGQLIRQVYNPILSDNQTTLENIPNGFYFLKINSENQSITKKVIIN